MSPGRRTRGAALLIALYPEAWRERYGEEMRALLEEDPPRARGLASLLRGAAAAHLRPAASWRSAERPADAMRRSVGAMFACWIVLAVAGSAFAKLTEHWDPAEHAHPVLAGARGAIMAGAALGAAAIALGGLPLVWHVLRVASRGRDRRLALLILSPALAAAAAAAFATLLAVATPAHDGRFPPWFVAGVLAPLALVLTAVAATAALAPKAVMRRAPPPAALLRLAAWSGQAMTAAMLLVTGGLLAFAAATWADAGALGAEATFPLGASTRVTLCLALVPAASACACACVAAARARRAALRA